MVKVVFGEVSRAEKVNITGRKRLPAYTPFLSSACDRFLRRGFSAVILDDLFHF